MLHEPGEEGGGERRVAFQPGPLERLQRALRGDRCVRIHDVALEFRADVNGKDGEVGEVEALHLVVAEDHDHVRARFRHPFLQRGEARLDAHELAPVRLEVVERNVRADRAALAGVVPRLRPAVAEGAVGGLEDADDLCHAA
ncbi:hypothetical protein D3C83_34010 [compost metagenome]